MKKAIKKCLKLLLLMSSVISVSAFSVPLKPDITVTLLGTGSPIFDENRMGPSTLVEINQHKFLFDSGRGTALRISQTSNPYQVMPSINQVFLTHLHSDHLTGLSDLYMTGWLYGRTQTFNIYGPTGTQLLIRNLKETYAADIDYRSQFKKMDKPATGLNFIAKEFNQDEVVFNKAGIKITAFLVDHAHVQPAFGYKVEYADRKVIISGDTRYSENLIKHSQNADLIIHEVAQASHKILSLKPALQKILDIHTTPIEAGRLFTKINPRYAIYNHIVLIGTSEEEVIQQTRSTYSGNIKMGKDLMKIEIGSEIIIK